MNRTQRLILVIALAVILLMLLFPPFVYRSADTTLNLGYSFILQPARVPWGMYKHARTGTVNVETLLAQWLAVGLTAAVGYLLVKKD